MMGRRSIPIEQRFWPRVDKRGPDECWLWKASARGKYGTISYRGKRDGAHRVSYMLNIGEIPDGLDVLHDCDNPRCVNPDHLHVGTKAQNMQEMYDRKRHPIVTGFGEANRLGKLKATQVLEIVDLLAKGYSHRGIGRMYGVSNVAIHNIRIGKSWSHLTGIGAKVA